MIVRDTWTSNVGLKKKCIMYYSLNQKQGTYLYRQIFADHHAQVA